jgi:peptidoglycan biosynthesis protein MviN/MurJ (putative lipid II flippase)
MGLGQAKWPTIATLAAGVLNLVLSLWWVGPYGVEGVAWAVFVPNVLLSVVTTYLVCRELDVPIWTYLGATLPLAMIGGFAGFAVLGWWQYLWGPQGPLGLGIAGLLTVVVVALLWGGLVLRNDPHLALPRVGDLLRGRTT